MPMSSLLISNQKVLSCNWLGTNNIFWCRQEWKMRISGVLFEQMRFSFDNLTHVVFWIKVEKFYKNPLKRSVLKAQFQTLWNLVDKNLFFTIHAKTTRNSQLNKKQIKYVLASTSMGRSLEVPTKYTLFSNAFFSSASVLLNFLINWPLNVA